MPKKKRSKPKDPYVVSPRRIDAGEILALARSGKNPRFRVSGAKPEVEFFKGMLKLLGVPSRRVMVP